MDGYNTYSLDAQQQAYVTSQAVQEHQQAPSSPQVYSAEAINTPTAGSYSTLQQPFGGSYQMGQGPMPSSGQATTYTYQPIMYTPQSAYGAAQSPYGQTYMEQSRTPPGHMTYTSVSPYQTQAYGGMAPQQSSQLYMLPPVTKKSTASKKSKRLCC